MGYKEQLHRVLKVAYGEQFDSEKLHDAITMFVGTAFLDRVHAEHLFKTKIYPVLKESFK